MCRTYIQSYFVTGPEVQPEVEPESTTTDPPPQSTSTWRQRLNNLNHRYAMAMGLQEN
jgi:hypothetical protein